MKLSQIKKLIIEHVRFEDMETNHNPQLASVAFTKRKHTGPRDGRNTIPTVCNPLNN